MTELTSTEKSPVLRVNGLSVSYNSDPVVYSVNFDIPHGAMSAIIGPNGAGKSTTLKAVVDIQPRLTGQIEIFGQTYDKVRNRISYVPQRASVDWDFPVTVQDVVLMGVYPTLGLLGRVRPVHWAKVMEALERVGMTGFADRQIGQLSGGQQQRVFLARALVQDADLYLLDEPFAGVDAATEKAIVKVLKDLQSKGKTIVAVHHDLTTVEAYFDHVVFINRSIVAAGSVAREFTEEHINQTYGRLVASQKQVI